MKILMFDVERGSKSLGSPEEIEKNFGYPVLQPTQYGVFGQIMGSLFTDHTEIVDKKVGSIITKEVIEKTVLNEGNELDVLIIDTFSELIKQKQLTISPDGKMKDFSDWGQLKTETDQLMRRLQSMEPTVICTVHGKDVQLPDGTNKIVPNMEGSSSNDISKWFDFVFYSGTQEQIDGSMNYVWYTQHTALHSHAKDRSGLLEPVIEQNYQTVLKAMADRGFNSAKILIIGSPGTGKTLSLKTLIKPKKATKKKVA